MFTGNYELVIIWWDESEDVFVYSTRDGAMKGARNMIKANYEQIAFWCVREQMNI